MVSGGCLCGGIRYEIVGPVGASLLCYCSMFANTYLITALNPRGIVFFVAFLPQFINPNAGVTRQLWILAVTFVVMATINATLYAAFAGSARKLLASPRAQKRFHLAGGSLLSVAGVWALLAKHPA
jgi:homoserine/homoserine lactone efflux protein